MVATRQPAGELSTTTWKPPMKTAICLVLSVAAMLISATPAFSADTSPAAPVGYDKAIEKYVRFLETQKHAPADYILKLFEKNDLVILCERAHPEVTQYDLIYEIVSNPRFQQQAGHIFVETGSTALRPYVEAFLTDTRLSDVQVSEKLRYIAWNIGQTGGWEKTNYYDFLRKLHHLNCSLPKDRQVQIGRAHV
jgi:hypothetical protein